MTQIEIARKGKISPEMKRVALKEGCDPEIIRAGIAQGTIVLTKNSHRPKEIEPVAIGAPLRIKVNANIGSSGDRASIKEELEKLKTSVEAGADTVMDLSTGGNADAIRRAIIKSSSIPVGTVPVYQAALDSRGKGKSLVELSPQEFFKAVEKHLKDGVDFITVHCGLTQAGLERLRKQGREMDIVSRGGTLMMEWMDYTGKENPYFERFDDLLGLAKKYDAVISLGDGLRPGALADASDRAQIHELIVLGELAQRAREQGVQTMIEGPGHVPLDQISANVLMEKKLCKGAPFYVLGPLVTDVAPGYDHITSAIGGALAGMAGADFLCYVTPSEHLRLPTIEDVREGVMASRIAAHAADIARGNPRAWEWDMKLSRARKSLDWESQYSLSIDPMKARKLREASLPRDKDVCTMCGEFCAIKKQQKRIMRVMP